MNLLWIALGWLLYGAIHSLLASFAFKDWVARRWPSAMPAYRLGFNIFAVVALLPIAWLVHGAESEWLWRWTGAWAWLANGLALAALASFWFSSNTYDMGEFLGLKPLREKRTDAAEHDGFRISPLHRHVRHPWYSLTLVLIWTRDMNGPLLVSAIAITLYFIIGSRLEENKLIAMHGNAYRRYRERVPGLVPLPWKRLSEKQASELLRDAPR